MRSTQAADSVGTYINIKLGGWVTASVRRSNNAAKDAREISVLNQTDLRSPSLFTMRTIGTWAATTTDIKPNPERNHLAPIIMIAKQ